MRKLIIGILLGFVLNSGLRTFYSYIWWKADAVCEKNTASDLKKEFSCVYENLDLVDNVKYILGYPGYDFQKWQMDY